ncbi:MAG: hypothetical protein ACYDAG_06475 [Chloroflexota bacterium]
MTGPAGSAQAFEDYLAAAVQAQSAASAAERDEARLEIAALSRRLVLLERTLRDSGVRHDDLPGMATIRARARQEYDRLVTVPGVRAVEVDGSTLRILTQPIRISWAGRTYQLGDYRLLLALNGDTRIESVDRLGPKPHWDHPHVQDGLPCLGNLRPGILKLIAEYEIALAAQVLVEFLQTYQPETAYCPIEGWPLA